MLVPGDAGECSCRDGQLVKDRDAESDRFLPEGVTALLGIQVAIRAQHQRDVATASMTRLGGQCAADQVRQDGRIAVAEQHRHVEVNDDGIDRLIEIDRLKDVLADPSGVDAQGAAGNVHRVGEAGAGRQAETAQAVD